MNAVVNFNGIDLEVLEFNDTWALSNKQVADGFGVSEEAIRSQKSRGEYRNNVHFYTVANCNGGGDFTFWTKKGVITLGFKLRETPQTVAFRDWASDFIIKSDKIITKNDLNLERKFTEVLSALSEKSIEADELRNKYLQSLERENLLLREKAGSETQTLKKSTRLSDAQRDEMVELYKNGLSQAEICRKTGRSDTAVKNAIRGAL